MPSPARNACIDALARELHDVTAQFASFEKTDLATVNDALMAKQLGAIVVPAAAPDAGPELGGSEQHNDNGRWLERD